MIVAVGEAERAGGANIVVIPRAQKLRAHHADQRHPAEQDGDPEQPPEARLYHTGQQDNQKQRWHTGPDFNHALSP